jgi:LSD1 subclass zinc finger protein
MTQTLHACERCATPIEKGDLRCAVCALGIPTDKALPVGDVFAKILRCGGCGAATAYDADARAVRCAFCTTELSLEEIRDPQEEVKQWMGFTVDRDAAVKALKNWLGRQGFFRPADMGSKAKVDDLQPLYFPAWMFDAEAEVSWAADSNLGSRRSAWAPHAGSTNITFDDVLVSASRGLNPKETSALLGTYAGGDWTASRPAPQRSAWNRFTTRPLMLSAPLLGPIYCMGSSSEPGSTLSTIAFRGVACARSESQCASRVCTLAGWLCQSGSWPGVITIKCIGR